MEATEQQAVMRSPLAEWHASHNGSLVQCIGWTMPADYGDQRKEYAAVREDGAGLLDLSSRGRIRVTGSEAVQFLNGLITNDMKTLAEHRWMPAVFPNVQGRLLASVRVIRLADEQGNKGSVPVFLLDTENATHERVLKTIERFTFAGDFHVNDLTSATVQISVQGKKSNEVLAQVCNQSWNDLPQHGALTITRNNTVVYVIRATHTGADGFDLITDSSHAVSLWEALIGAGAVPVGSDALEILRIEAGLSRYGSELDDSLVVSEANLDDAVSFTKGCYIGQEIIARIKYRGHVAKKITGVAFDGLVKIETGAMITAPDGSEIGRLTSVVDSPMLQRTVGLALIKYQYLTAGTNVRVAAGDEMVQGQVTELPFVKSD